MHINPEGLMCLHYLGCDLSPTSSTSIMHHIHKHGTDPGAPKLTHTISIGLSQCKYLGHCSHNVVFAFWQSFDLYMVSFYLLHRNACPMPQNGSGRVALLTFSHFVLLQLATVRFENFLFYTSLKSTEEQT